MGCTSSEAAVPSIRNKLVDEYINLLRLESGEKMQTRAYLNSKSQTMFNSMGDGKKLDQHNSPCCILEVSFPSMEKKGTWGTGSLINPILVLTSATNVYSHRDKQFAQTIVRFYDKKQTTVEVARIFAPEAFMQGDLNENYALVVLHEPVTEFGFYGISVPTQPQAGMFVNMLGFPIKEGQSVKDFKKYMQGNRGMVESVDQQKGLLSHRLTNDFGVSGAGLYVIKNHFPYIIAVHSRRDPTNPELSKATLLTEQRLGQLKQWTSSLLTKQFERDTLCRIDFTAVEAGRSFY